MNPKLLELFELLLDGTRRGAVRWDLTPEKGMYRLLLDRGLAALQAERRYYDFVFGRFRFQGLRQKFWQPFEVEHRLAKAGFTAITLSKVLYPWDQSLADSGELEGFPRSWDWFFQALLSP